MGTSTQLPMKVSRAWAPRADIAPETARGDGTYTITSNGSAGCYGGWDLVYPALDAGRWVRFRVKVSWQDLERSYDSVNAALVWLDADDKMVGWEPIFPTQVKSGKVHYELRAETPAGAAVAVARLLMAHSSRGQIEWSEPVIAPAAKPRARRVRQ